MSSSSTTSNTATGGRPAPRGPRPPAGAARTVPRPGAAPRSGVAGAGPAAEPVRPAATAQRDGAAEPVEDGAPRQVRLTVAHVNPWTVLRLSFLLSVAAGVVLVVVVALMWSVLDGIGIFQSANSVVRDVVGTESRFDLMSYVGLSKVLSLTVLIAVVDVVLLTVLATLAAVLYNICGALVGGVRLTLTDD